MATSNTPPATPSPMIKCNDDFELLSSTDTAATYVYVKYNIFIIDHC